MAISRTPLPYLIQATATSICSALQPSDWTPNWLKPSARILQYLGYYILELKKDIPQPRPYALPYNLLIGHQTGSILLLGSPVSGVLNT